MKKIYTLVGTALISGIGFAQSPYQFNTYNFAPQKHEGAITTTTIHPDDQNQDRTIYYSENFDGGLNGWVSDIQAGAGGFQGFKISNVGHINTSTFIIPDLLTSTPTNWILLDSDGDAGGSYTTPEQATLNSQRIDLTTTLGSYVAIEFDQFFAEWDINTYSSAGSEDHCYIGVSTDSIAWTEVEINEGVGRDGRPNPELISWDISDYIAVNLDSVWIRFRWEGAWNYGWQLDNVSIVDINANDLTIMDTYRNYNSNGLVFSQVPLAHVSEFTIGAIIRNTGHFQQTGVTFDFVIKDPSNAVVSTGTAPVALILNNAEQDTILVSTGFIPTALGNYTVEWTATSIQGDDNLTDNVDTDAFFEVTEFTFAQDYNEGVAVEIENWPSLTGMASFGNLFNFEVADQVSALQVQLTNHVENVGELIFIKVWVLYDGGTAWEELYLSPNDYVVTTADIGQMLTLPFPLGLDVQPLNLYLFQIGQYATPVQPLFLRQGDIGFSYIQGMDDADANRGFFDRLAPIVRIRVNANEVGIDDNQPTEEVFSVYPNPANDVINISLTLTQSENTTINILDLTGKVIKTIYVGELDGTKNLSVSLDGMASGIYFIELVNADGRQVKKFVKK